MKRLYTLILYVASVLFVSLVVSSNLPVLIREDGLVSTFTGVLVVSFVGLFLPVRFVVWGIERLQKRRTQDSEEVTSHE